MKQLFVALITLTLFNTVEANITIHNNNSDDNYSMKVTYRSCHYTQDTLTCDNPSTVTLSKGSDYIDDKSETIIIDNAALINDLTQDIKANSVYIQYTIAYTNLTFSYCYAQASSNPGSFSPQDTLILDDMSSSYVICQKTKQKFTLPRVTP